MDKERKKEERIIVFNVRAPQAVSCKDWPSTPKTAQEEQSRDCMLKLIEKISYTVKFE